MDMEMTTHDTLMALLKQTNQFHANADVSTEQVVSALAELVAERDALQVTVKRLEVNAEVLQKLHEEDSAEWDVLAAERDALREALGGVMYWDNGKPEWETAKQALKGTPT